MGRKKKYKTEEERKTAKREQGREAAKRWRENHPEYYQENRDGFIERSKLWKQENKEKKSEYDKQRYRTPIVRAKQLIKNYKRDDKKYNRGECTLTAQWIVDNIFSKPCHYCGETDWCKLGCDRINNELPHTPDNVIPCCTECNKKRQKMDYETFKNTFINNNITN